jgi:hypothetical protein
VLRHKAEGRYTYFIVKLQRNPIRKKQKTLHWTVTGGGGKRRARKILYSLEKCAREK